MRLQRGVISVDDHVQEHPEVWKSRMSWAKFGDRIPHVERQPEGTERWMVDGKVVSLLGAASDGVAAVGAAMPDPTREPRTWSEVPTVAYVPHERLRAMDMDGIDVSVLYPNVAGLAGETLGRIADSELELACVRAYNDFLVEEWAKTSERFVPQCIVPLGPIEEAVFEVRRAVAKGHRGVVFPAVPWHLRPVPHINEPYWDPLWTAAEELDVPLCLHAGSSEMIQFPADPRTLSPELQAALRNITRPASSIQVVANFLYSGILERHPRLRVVFAESTITWGAYELEIADHHHERMRIGLEGHPVKPSELFRRQCFYTGWYDRAGIKARRHIGTEHILWGTSFPLTTSTWPNTKTYLERAMSGVPADEQDKIKWANAARLYHLV